ncbi:MAG: type II toxin-antitoxin system Phd/YefM family antitoxin [Truepera sp.]|nr:type II toxin-antitoxin system Phd/YefM family antitoxin [Truepera sp.]
MSKTVSIAEAKKQLSSWVRDVEHGETVMITRRGKPVAALVSTDNLKQLMRLRAAGPEAGLAGLAGLAGGWEDSEALVAQALAHVRTSGRQPRENA